MGVVVGVGCGPGDCESEPVMNDPCPWLIENRRCCPRAETRWTSRVDPAGMQSGLPGRASGAGRRPGCWGARRAHSGGARRGLSLQTRVVDLEGGRTFLEPDSFDLIVVAHYLHRPLFPALVSACVRAALVYETLRVRRPRGETNQPAFLLEPGELVGLVRPLEDPPSREGDFEGRMIVSVIARRD